MPLANSIAPIYAIVPDKFDFLRRMRSPSVIQSGRFVASSFVDAALLEEAQLVEESADAGERISLSSKSLVHNI